MRNTVFLFIISLCLAIILTPVASQAEEAKIGVAAVKVNALENDDYYRNVVQDRISTTFQAKRNLSVVTTGEGDVGEIFKEYKGLTHYLRSVVTVAGSNIQLDFLLYERDKTTDPQVFSSKCESLDEFLPKLDNELEKIKAAFAVPEKAAKTAAKTTEEEPPSIDEERPARPLQPQWPIKNVLLELDGLLSAIAPMKVQDKELMALVLENSIQLYDPNARKVLNNQAFKGSTVDNFVYAFACDIDGDGDDELWINNIQDASMKSYLLKLAGVQFQPLITRSKWFARKIEIDGKVNVYGQVMKQDGEFYGSIYQLIYSDEEMKKGEELDTPSYKVDVMRYNLIDHDGDGKKNIYYLSKTARMTILDVEGDKLQKSVSSYGGSMVYFEIPQVRGEPNDTVYVNRPPETVDMGNDGKEEILAIRNIPSMPIQFSRMHFYKEGELVMVRFDGYDFIDKQIYSLPGCISDFYIRKNPDGYGDELYLAQVTSKFLLGSSVSRLVLINNFW